MQGIADPLDYNIFSGIKKVFLISAHKCCQTSPGTEDDSSRSSDRAVGRGAASGSSRIGLEEGWKDAKMKSCRFHLFPTTTSPVQKTSPGNVRSQGLTLLPKTFVQADIAGQVLVIRIYLKSFREKISTELM